MKQNLVTFLKYPSEQRPVTFKIKNNSFSGYHVLAILFLPMILTELRLVTKQVSCGKEERVVNMN